MPEDVLSRKLQHTYAVVAERYAKVNSVMPVAVLEAAQKFVSLLSDATSILDLGCGTGRDSLWFEQQGHHVTSVDLSKAMLRQAWDQGVVRLVQANMCALPLSTNSVGAIWANASMLHIPREFIMQVLHECSRVLTHDGLIFTAMQVGDGEVWEDVSYGQRAPRFFTRYQSSAFRSLLVSAGFHIHSFEEQNVSPKRHWMHFYAYKSL